MQTDLVPYQTLTKDIVLYLLPWFQKAKRDLAWRKDPTPYRVWVSEIMLQQTRVEAVKPYYDRFMATLPDIASLAAANEELLLKLWEGLGYYRRVRNMQAAAKIIMKQYNGIFPDTYEAVRALPGIGDYTAGAILSIAFNQPIPAVDGNVMRVISRLIGSSANIDEPKVKKNITEMLRKIYPKHYCSYFTQSLMEVGAIVCLPNGNPLCARCPLQTICIAKQNYLTDEIPVRSQKAKRKVVDLKVLLIIHNEQIALRKRPEDGLLAGLWEFPNFPDTVSDDTLIHDFQLSDYHYLTNAKHIFTHIEWNMRIYIAHTGCKQEAFQWFTETEMLNNIALPGAFRTAKQNAIKILGQGDSNA